jgi:hypothetical protein
MARAIDLTGHVFERLTVVEREGTTKNGSPSWLCRCVCGVETVACTISLRRGDTKSCGCYRREKTRRQWKEYREAVALDPAARLGKRLGAPRVDLAGRVVGRLTVLHPVAVPPTAARVRRAWLCRCECGAETVVAGDQLTRGGTRSCGCLARELTSVRTKARWAARRATQQRRAA